ncbi:MAG: exosortase [Deltaproteobacteria bacterium]|nr:exosortase [Deltaproteobacteria bacterium]
MTRAKGPVLKFCLLAGAGSFAVLYALREQAAWIYASELYSHILIVPFISAYFFIKRRAAVFRDAQNGHAAGAAVYCAGAAVHMLSLAFRETLGRNDYISASLASLFLFILGAFVVSFGARSLKAGAFPVFFLVFMIPLPVAAMDAIIYALQSLSTDAVHAIVKAAGVPVTRDGFVLRFPGLSIEVAKECSGIRSSLVLVITGSVASQMYLRSYAGKAALLLSVLPITVLKNSLRITTLTLLGLYWDERTLHGSLHTRGGLLFFLLALSTLALVAWAIRKAERGRS